MNDVCYFLDVDIPISFVIPAHELSFLRPLYLLSELPGVYPGVWRFPFASCGGWGSEGCLTVAGKAFMFGYG